jgi:hypothetical protein
MLHLSRAFSFSSGVRQVLQLTFLSFGGLALSQAVSAAFLALPPSNSVSGQDYHLFSIQGSYLGPASTEVPTTFTVDDVRTTRSMVTRLVTASQVVPSKPTAASPRPAPTKRKVLVCICDFHRPETAFLLYSAPLLHPGSYPLASECTPLEDLYETLPFAPGVLNIFKSQFGLPSRMFQYRPVMTSAGAQNNLGFLQVKTSQDELELTERTSTNWIKANGELATYADRCAALA